MNVTILIYFTLNYLLENSHPTSGLKIRIFITFYLVSQSLVFFYFPTDHQSNTVDESSEEEDGEETSLNMSVMELHRHQEIVDNTLEDSNSSDSDTTITASLKKRARIGKSNF